jgi:hypothetical protein
MSAEAAAMSRARRAYELGMLRLGLLRASLVTGTVALLIVLEVTRLPSPAWLALVFLLWLGLGWRGALVWRGALGGLAGGLAALALPLTLLRPCCTPEAMASAASCSPQTCVGAGMILGVAVAAMMPRVRGIGEWSRAAGGALLAVVSLVAFRCTTLFVGESVGLLGGMLATAAGVSVARAWWSKRALS